MTSRSPRRGLLVSTRLSVLLLLAACATPQHSVQDREERLLAAGFVARPADTPGRAAALQTLPAHMLLVRPIGVRFVYLYADPLVCGCLLVGSESAFSRFRQVMIQRHLATGQQLAAKLDADPGRELAVWGGLFGSGPALGAGF